MNGRRLTHIAAVTAIIAATMLTLCPEASAEPGIFKKKSKAKTEKVDAKSQKSSDTDQKQSSQNKKTTAKAQNSSTLTNQESDKPKEPQILHYIIEDGDTIFVERLRPCWCYGKSKNKAYKGINWRKHSKLVYNFNKVYPYATMGRMYVQRLDTTLAGGDYSRKEKKALINNCQDELLRDFEPVIREMTISQGQLLCRLVDREINKTAFQIVKDYKNSFSAGFWQGVAKLFKQDLKSHYDPDGADAYTEQLIHMWETGEFDYLYHALFRKWPEHTFIPEQYR